MFGQLRYQAGRLMDAARFGLNAASFALRDEDRSVDSQYFDSYGARMKRYARNIRYLENTQYTPYNRLRFGSYMTARYRHMRGIYNFVSRLVDLEVNKTYGGRIDWAGDLRTGAIPVVLAKSAHPELLESIKLILEWSNFGDGKDLYVRNGSTLGDSFLKAVTIKDETTQRFNKVILEVLDPHKVLDIWHDIRGNVNAVVIQYVTTDMDEMGHERVLTIREEIDRTEFRVWREYNPVPWDNVGKRAPDESYPNLFGFVPVVHVRHKMVVGGRKWGVTSFQNTLDKIDELNDGASVTKDGLAKGNNPMLIIKGGKIGKPNEELRARDNILVFELSDAEMDVQTITPTTDVAGSIANMDKETSEIESDVPALSLQRIREKGGNPSGVAIENSYSDASDSLEAIQGNYDERLVRGLQMCLTMAGMLGLPEFPYTQDSYDQGALRFYLKERKVFTDNLSMDRRLELMVQAADNDAWELIYRELGVSEEDIEALRERKAESEERQTSAAIRGLAQGFNMDDQTDEEASDDPSASTEENA